jgi:hypothetical protein
MQTSPVADVRRGLLRGALGLIGLAFGGPGKAAQHKRPARAAPDGLLAQASVFVDAYFQTHGNVVAGPVSLLQRNYHLGYGTACQLAAELESAQVWTVFHDTSGMRCARKANP